MILCSWWIGYSLNPPLKLLLLRAKIDCGKPYPLQIKPAQSTSHRNRTWMMTGTWRYHVLAVAVLAEFIQPFILKSQYMLLTNKIIASLSQRPFRYSFDEIRKSQMPEILHVLKFECSTGAYFEHSWHPYKTCMISFKLIISCTICLHDAKNLNTQFKSYIQLIVE
jgi:hypothetical protein